MGVRVYSHGDDVYLTGAGSTGCLRWSRVDGRWHCAPAQLPDGAESAGPEAVPDDLREELLAFITRAAAMGQDPAAATGRPRPN